MRNLNRILKSIFLLCIFSHTVCAEDIRQVQIDFQDAHRYSYKGTLYLPAGKMRKILVQLRRSSGVEKPEINNVKDSTHYDLNLLM